MTQYLTLLQKILAEGIEKPDRTGTGTISLFGHQMRFDLSKNFPLLTTKKIHLRSVIFELLWMLRGDTNIKFLNDNSVTIWDEWADVDGNLGPIYGHQWSSWPAAYNQHINQIERVQESLRKTPESRRHIVTAWNPTDLEKMALPPCHILFQFYVAQGKLSCQLYQRSADAFLGVPFNIASYSLLTLMLAQTTGLKPGEFIHTFGDVHIYLNHIKQVDTQLKRQPRELPVMTLNSELKPVFDFTYQDFSLTGYDPHPGIKAEVAV